MADQGSEGVLSPYLRLKRFKAVAPHLTGRVLDFGCGSGQFAAYVEAENYYGVDIDEQSLIIAKKDFPHHVFSHELPPQQEKFDSIISMAVVEHVAQPEEFLQMLAGYLIEEDSSPDAKIILTTPHPSMDFVHKIGSSVGLFSKHANEEHEDLLGRSRLEQVGNTAGLKIVKYGRFCFGANQIVVLQRN